MKKLLQILWDYPDCFILYSQPNEFTIYKEKPKYPNDDDYMNVVTLFEGNDTDLGKGHVPGLAFALATTIGVGIDSIDIPLE
jgi:hypothetical protein